MKVIGQLNPNDLHDLADLVIHSWDDFPSQPGVVSPMEMLVVQHGKAAVWQAVDYLRRVGMISMSRLKGEVRPQ